MEKNLEKFINMCYHLFGQIEKKRKKREKNNTKREDDIMTDAVTLSNYIIRRFNQNKVSITNLKLQKILYYVQGYSLKMFGVPAFDDEIYAWHYGPVVPMAYYEFNIYGACPLTWDVNDELPIFKARYVNMVDAVIDKCMPYFSSALVEKTHREAPWKNAYVGSVITKRAMKFYFDNNDPLGVIE